MDDLTRMSLESLKRFEAVLEESKMKIQGACDMMDSGISMCSHGMKDEPSQKALRETQQITAEIRACLNPTERLLELIKELIIVWENEMTM